MAGTVFVTMVSTILPSEPALFVTYSYEMSKGVVEYPYHNKRYEREELVTLLRSFGFDVRQMSKLYSKGGADWYYIIFKAVPSLGELEKVGGYTLEPREVKAEGTYA